jgi:hypothetical protein
VGTSPLEVRDAKPPPSGRHRLRLADWSTGEAVRFVHASRDICEFLNRKIREFEIRSVRSYRANNVIVVHELTNRLFVRLHVEIERDDAEPPEQLVLRQHVSELQGRIAFTLIYPQQLRP